MAIDWMMSLRDIPWSKVTSSASSVAEGAKNLWERVSRRNGEVGTTPLPARQAPDSPSEAVAALEIRVQSLEKRIAVLDEEAVSSFEVVRALTDHHSTLVDAVDRLIVRTRVLLRACVLLAVALIGLIVLVLSR